MSATDVELEPDVPAAAAGREERHDRLATAASRLRRRRTSLPVDKWFQLAGSVLVPLGVLLIIVGWYGAARTTREWQQTPYLVSGGMLGLGLIFAGGFSYYAFWLTKLLEQGRQQTDVLERIEIVLRKQAGLPEVETTIVVAPSGTAHRPDCPVIAGKEGLRPARPDEAGLRPCLMCEPELEPAAKARSRRA